MQPTWGLTDSPATWTGESEPLPWVLLRNWHYLASGWQVCISEWLQLTPAVMCFGVLSYASWIPLKLCHETGDIGMVNWMNVGVNEFSLSDKSLISISLRSVSGILSRSYFPCLRVLVSVYKMKQPTLLVFMEWSCVGDVPFCSARPEVLVVSPNFVIVQAAFFVLSGSGSWATVSMWAFSFLQTCRRCSAAF